jgi:hypothetical protein
MTKEIREIQSQLSEIYKLSQKDDEVCKDELMLRSLIALSALVSNMNLYARLNQR